jgi:hypothetical protein
VPCRRYLTEGLGPRIILAPFIKYNPDYTYVFGTEGVGCEERSIAIQIGRRVNQPERMTPMAWRELQFGNKREFAFNEAMDAIGDPQ